MQEAILSLALDLFLGLSLCRGEARGGGDDSISFCL